MAAKKGAKPSRNGIQPSKPTDHGIRRSDPIPAFGGFESDDDIVELKSLTGGKLFRCDLGFLAMELERGNIKGNVLTSCDERYRVPKRLNKQIIAALADTTIDDDEDATSSPQSANGIRPLQSYLKSLLGPPYRIDDFDNPESAGVYGQPSFSAPWCDDDKDGIPIITDFLRKSYDWQIECWERECREAIAKYGCSIDPRDPVPAPLPDEATEVEKDARRLVVAVHGLKKSVLSFRFADAIVFAVDLGSLKRKLQSRWADALVDRGRKHRSGGMRGGDRRRAAESDKWESWQREASEFRLKYPQIKSKRELAKLIHNRHIAPGDPLSGIIEAIRKKI